MNRFLSFILLGTMPFSYSFAQKSVKVSELQHLKSKIITNPEYNNVPPQYQGAYDKMLCDSSGRCKCVTTGNYWEDYWCRVMSGWLNTINGTSGVSGSGAIW